jgi:uncharacterized protein YmfQ (DUF2313 family)
MTDSHVRRSGDDYARGFAGLLPTGAAWPRDSDSILMQFINGLAQIWGDVDARADDLLARESDPRLTLELLLDWETAFGLPDECMGPASTLEERHTRLLQRITMLGGQSRAFFIALAAMLGYTITIEELSPIMGGISRGGESDWEAGAPEIRFYWIVHISGVPIWWFRGGVGEGGKDHHAEWAALTDLECLIRRYKPAHTYVIFDYSS